MLNLPMVTIIWLNYNSEKIINVIKESLRSIANLDYPKYEVVVIDNNSTDNSDKVIYNFLQNENLKNFRFIKTNKNLGFCGGNNLGFKIRDPQSRYVALINSDMIVETDSLKKIIKFMEANK
ncbi:MAG: glycosyltransferase, partial [Crenarchaeota archaeon]|nr:glycosyltransferase [Thermoproteota archaeon]